MMPGFFRNNDRIVAHTPCGYTICLMPTVYNALVETGRADTCLIDEDIEQIIAGDSEGLRLFYLDNASDEVAADDLTEYVEQLKLAEEVGPE